MQHDGQRLGRRAGEPADPGRPARASTWSIPAPREVGLPGRPGHRRAHPRARRPAHHQARLAQGHHHGAGDRRHPDPEAAVGTGADRRVPHPRHRAHGAAVAADRGRASTCRSRPRRRCSPAAWCAGWSSGAPGAPSSRSPRSSRDPACCSRAGSSRAARWPASRSPAWRPRWSAGGRGAGAGRRLPGAHRGTAADARRVRRANDLVALAVFACLARRCTGWRAAELARDRVAWPSERRCGS